MPVTITLYNCEGCKHCDDCPDYVEHQRFAVNGIRITAGASSVRCHHAQHNRRKDYNVDLQGMRLRELLSCFGFIDIGHDDGCLNRCRECARTDCDLHPYHKKSRGGFWTQAKEAMRGAAEFNRQMHEVEKAMKSPHQTGRAADFTHSGDGIYEARIDASQTQYPYMHVEFGDTPTWRERMVKACERALRDGGAV